jgi:hypothetical protein
MNDNYKLDMEYIAGLFDGKGSIYYKKVIEKRKTKKPTKVWKIRMEMSMPDKNVMELVHETLGCGTLREKKVVGKKNQWRWQSSHRDALYVCKLLWPHTTIKLHKIEQIIDHYEPDIQDLGDNIVDLALERETRQS